MSSVFELLGEVLGKLAVLVHLFLLTLVKLALLLVLALGLQEYVLLVQHFRRQLDVLLLRLDQLVVDRVLVLLRLF